MNRTPTENVQGTQYALYGFVDDWTTLLREKRFSTDDDGNSSALSKINKVVLGIIAVLPS